METGGSGTSKDILLIVYFKSGKGHYFMDKPKIIITGAAGLVGQNLILLLKEYGYHDLIAIDKHKTNTDILRKLNPDITVIQADLSAEGSWMSSFQDCDIAITLHAQIGAKDISPFEKNNIESTKNVLKTVHKYNVPYLIHTSSSVVNSAADDKYTNTKKIQESLVKKSSVPYCILRPTLMFGWFDRKHLGWLSRFMKKTPFFPIPGDGKYMRQPLYARDFCKIIISAIEQKPVGQIFDITGKEKVYYIDIIRSIKEVLHLHTPIICIPYSLFDIILKSAALILKEPPFTTEQLAALVAGDEFEVIPWENIFNVEPTPFKQAIKETFTTMKFSEIELEF